MKATFPTKKKTVLACLALIVLAGILVFGRDYAFGQRPAVVVEARADGFYPKEIHIRTGQTVAFVTKIDRSIWPASDPHPTHSGYPGFDAGRPVNPGSSWRFTFDKVGIWGFHDHLDPSFTGTVIVTPDAPDSDAALAEECARLNLTENSTCFDEQLRETVRTKGVDAAFELLAHKYDVGNVPAACHWSAHKIGEEAYEQEKKGVPLQFTHETYYCGYGFYHGYLEVMLRSNPRPDSQKEKVMAFCDQAQKQLGGEARDNCYHGIGSGYTENPPDPTAWGKPQLVVSPGLNICARLFGTTREWEMCTTGVYAVLANFMSYGTYGFAFDPKDPLAFCATQDPSLHRACYGEFSAKLGALAHDDLPKIADYVRNVKDQGTAKTIVNVSASSMMQEKVLESDQSYLIPQCRAFPDYLRPVCFDGIVWGLLYHGRIDEEEGKAIAFCDSKLFSASERDFCYQRLAARAKNMYSPERFAAICKEIGPEYRHYCDENLPVQL